VAEDKVKQVMISGKLIGIVGLNDAVVRTAQALPGSADAEIKNNLLTEVSENNYIPDAARDAYGQALLREFKLAQNLPVEQDTSNDLTITVLGMGCTRCSQLETDVRDLLEEMKIAADLRHITDPKEIARYCVLGAPALLVNNKVVSAGDVPPKSKIRQWLIDALNQSADVTK
jgi:hypothetical protein